MGEQRMTIESKKETGKKVTEENQNPYRPFDTQTGEWFYHEAVIRQIKEIFETKPENQVIALYGKPGSGKTSILKRISSTAVLPVDKFVPIYLDTENYTGLTSQELLNSVYKDAADRIKDLGYDIPEVIYKKEENTLDNILSFYDRIFPGKILVFILGKFDLLMANMFYKFIADLINYITPLNKDLSKYRLIISGDMGVIDLYSDDTIKRFLASASHIYVEDVLDEETIRRAIVEPVKHRLSYDDDAIGEIIRLCGKNLLFQQLICFNIVNHLEKEKRNHCTINDVDQAIKQILKEKIPQLVQAWENNISVKNRLFASALADENVVEKRGSIYYLKKSLLDDIFGEEIEKEIDKLEEYGYVYEMDERQFARPPFIIPFYRKWVKKNHPFIKTVIENIEDIADKIELKRFIEEIDKTPAKKLMPFKKTPMLDLAQKWCLLTGSILKKRIDKDTRRNHIKNFFSAFSQTLNLNLEKGAPTDQDYFVMDIKPLNIGILDQAFCFIQDRPGFTKDDIFKIEKTAVGLTEEMQTKVILIFYIKESSRIEKLVKESRLNLITMAENELKKIFFSKQPAGVFKKIILGKLPLTKVSPYQSAGPVKSTFYSRSDVIDRIIGSSNKSFAIVGGKKIGKTSLLHRIYEKQPEKTVYIFMDLDSVFSNAKNYRPFRKNLEAEIERKLKKKKVFGRLPFRKNLFKLPVIIREFSRENINIVFIFDGADQLIRFDQKKGYRILQLFRTMSRENYCQFILAGFEELYQGKQGGESSFYDFYEKIMLQPLEKAAAFDLSTKPLESLDIHYKNKKDARLILKYTACHPNLIQFSCKRLVEKLKKNDEIKGRRTISREDVKELFDDAYEKYILDEIYMFFKDLSNINRLILILMTEEQSKSKKRMFSLNEILDLLTRQGINISDEDIKRHLRNLVMRFILREKARNNFSFALTGFPGILKKRVSHDYKNQIIEEIKKNDPGTL
jgi:Cdc6-like AAA superfamily ATPase